MNPRKSHLTTVEWALLNNACHPVREAFGFSGPYLVGSATERADYRDIDVRVVLADEEFDRLFHGKRALWSLMCLTIGQHLAAATGLPVDFQIQRRTEANAKYDGPMHPLAVTGFTYAGGGDATRFTKEARP